MTTAIIIVAGLGLIASIILVIVDKFMYVEVDQKAVDIREMLPGANCGACGFAGCDDYAANLASGSCTKANACTPGGNELNRKICEYLGLPYEEAKAVKAFVKCSGNYDTSEYVMDYDGPKSCKSCNAFYQGRRSCTHGCLGYGDCVEACKFDALSINNGLAVVNRAFCTGCGACAKACPDNLFDMIPETARVFVGCASHDKGAYTRKICKAGCIGCMKCVKTCEYGAIVVEENLASIDYEKCTNCGKCAEACPTKVIHMA